MSTIIAGRFDEDAESVEAASALHAAGFEPDRIASFFLSPSGQNFEHKLDEDKDRNAGPPVSGEGTSVGVAAGGGAGAVAGVAATPLLGPAGPIVGAALGAYIGSLAGSLGQVDKDGQSNVGEDKSETRPEEPPVRRSGMMVAVSVASDDEEARAVSILRAHGAQDLERADGTIEQADWKDFDPLSELHLLRE